MANNPVSGTDPDGGWVNVGMRQAYRETDIERSRRLGSDGFDAVSQHKRYRDALQNLKDHYLNSSKGKFDPEAFMAGLMGLNSYFMGISTTNTKFGLTSGWNEMPQNEVSKHHDLVVTSNANVSSYNVDSYSKIGGGVNNMDPRPSGNTLQEMQWTTNGYDVADHDNGRTTSYYTDYMQVGQRDNAQNGEHDDWIVGYTKETDYGNGNVVRDSWNVVNDNMNSGTLGSNGGPLIENHYNSNVQNPYDDATDGSFNGVPVFVLPGLGNDEAFTLTNSIFISQYDRGDKDLLRHEFGHYLYAQAKGNINWWIMAQESIYSTMSDFKHKTSWTEWQANYLSYIYFGKPSDWDRDRFPLGPTNMSNPQALYPGNVGWYFPK
ncbi:MAG: hypothetical protein K0S32_706 [Bacteroidetes bacterium]|jgi:hypothetical protein|nr:hypothetical protein [Bacteroidota bacterium]